MTKIFLTDIDGVVLNFHRTFEHWVHAQGIKPVHEHIVTENYYIKIEEWLGKTYDETEDLINQFFETDYSEHFIPYHDAVEVIPFLKNNGWTFVAVTAIGYSKLAKEHRQHALDKIFGKYVFSDVVVVDPFESKFVELAKFDPTLWIDDTPHHVKSGIDAGHTSFRIQRELDHRHNIKMDGFNVVKDWYEVKKWLGYED